MSLNLSILEILYLFAAFHGIFLASILVIKRSWKHNTYLFFLLLLFTFYLTENVIYSSGYIRSVPHLYFTTLPLIFLIGPLFYTYVRASTNPNFKLRIMDLIHLAPFVFEVTILIPFFLLSGEIKVRIFDASQASDNSSNGFSIYFIGYLIYIISTFLYFYASFRILRKSLPVGSRQKRKLTGFKRVSLAFSSYVLLSLILSLLSMPFPEMDDLLFHLNLISLTILIHVIGYIAFLDPGLTANGTRSNYEFSTIGDVRMNELSKQLKDLMEQDQPYLTAEFSAEDLSQMLSITKHQLSQLLNVGLKTTFYDLVNHYRIEHSKRLLQAPAYTDAKILHIAFDSGFSNKASFLRNFKKLTGKTPSDFKRLSENQVSIN